MHLFQYAAYVDRINGFLEDVQKHYIDSKAPHVSDASHSIIKIIQYPDFVGMTPSSLQDIMKVKHVVVTGWPINKDAKFDESSMRSLVGSLQSQVYINGWFHFFPLPGVSHIRSDYSVDSSSLVPTLVSGYASDILLNSSATGRILNGLEFPMSDADHQPNSYSADLAAWDVTRGQHNMPAKAIYPTGDFRWGTAGTAGTMTFTHIDCDGLNSNDGPLCGMKVWGLGDTISQKSLSSIYFFLDESFHLNDVLPNSPLKFEAIVLRPGDMLSASFPLLLLSLFISTS